MQHYNIAKVIVEARNIAPNAKNDIEAMQAFEAKLIDDYARFRKALPNETKKSKAKRYRTIGEITDKLNAVRSMVKHLEDAQFEEEDEENANEIINNIKPAHGLKSFIQKD